jgi:uncharacterized protein (DUF3084 family)
MNNKIDNPFLKQLISGISQKANQGRITDIGWSVLEEAKKKKSLKKEAIGEKKKEEPAADAADEKSDELPALDAAPDAAAEAPDAPKADAKDAAEEAPDTAKEESDKAQADAAEAKAELEKAKAEKDQAEKEIKKHSYIKLGSGAGTQFLLGKILDHAFKTNTIDALAGEMVQKLKITTPEDMNAFSEETATYRVIPGMPELLSSMKTMATKQEQPEETPEA